MRGWPHCRAEFVANLDSDDLAYPQRFEHQLAYLREHPECVGVSGGGSADRRAWSILGGGGSGWLTDDADANWLPAREPYLIHSFLMARLFKIARHGRLPTRSLCGRLGSLLADAGARSSAQPGCSAGRIQNA